MKVLSNGLEKLQMKNGRLIYAAIKVNILRDTMKRFLIEHGTQEEIQQKLDSFGFNIPADESLREEVQKKRPNIDLE